MSVADAWRLLLEPVDGALGPDGLPDWDRLDDPVWVSRLSSGERVLWWAAWQLAGRDVDPELTVGRALPLLDRDCVVRLLAALALAAGIETALRWDR